jgi:hypothetical protein
VTETNLNAKEGAASAMPLVLRENESPISDKRGFGRRWGFSARTIDNLIAQGLPHWKVGKRRVRIIVAEGDAWMRQRFGVQRRSNASGR